MVKNGKDDALFQAILDDDRASVSRLKERGVTLTDDVKYALTHSAGTLVKPTEYSTIQWSFQGTIQRALMDGQLDYFVSVLRNMREAVGEPLFFSNSAIWGCTDNFYDRAAFECILDCFDNRKINKKQNMIYAVDNDRLDLLEIAIAHDWLKMPRKRDEMIAYAESKGQTEIVAYLLDYKNRTADLAAERAKAEKRAERELNAAPDSVTALKQLWSYKKREDGTLEITNYKGRQTEVVIPERIGKDLVTSIGNRAFTGDRYAANRTPEEICEFRKNNITKITLPETINNIGSGAFLFCEALKEVNIPSGVTIINSNTFTNTAIDTIELPETVERLADYAFSAVHFKKIKLPQNLAEIGKGALESCDFERIEIPPKVKVINPEMFWRCQYLKEVVLPEGLEEIKPRAFWLCPSLEKINLPASITKIENFKRGGKVTSPFADNPKLTATVERGSYAEKYCKLNGIP